MNCMRPAKHRRSRSRLSALLSLQNAIALAIVVMCVVTGWWLVTQSGVNFSTPQQFIQSIQDLGHTGVLLYIGFLIVAMVIGPIPGTPMTIAAGAIWGPIPAGLYGITGVYLGSLAAYFIGRSLGRSVVRVLTGKSIYFSTHRGETYLGWLVFLTHLLPVMPYELISYGAGISGLSLPIYASASLLGIIPCTFLLTGMGSAFTIGLPVAIALMVLFVLLLIVLPWGVKRYNWLGLQEVIRFD